MTSTPLEISRVTMRFGGLKALSEFSLEMRPGELVGLIGPNGAGKTTAFNAITGVYEPTEGDVVVGVEDRLVTDNQSLIVALRTHQPGDTVTLRVRRGDDERDVEVTLAGRVG